MSRRCDILAEKHLMHMRHNAPEFAVIFVHIRAHHEVTRLRRRTGLAIS